MKYLIAFSFLIALFACNKDKFYSKRLMKGDIWAVQSITINDTLSEISGTWKITQDVNIYDSVPQVYWNNNGNDAYFQWQFHEKAKKFYLNYQILCEECEPNTLDTLDYFCNALSGTYDVEKRSRKEMIFTTTTSDGFNAKKVEISLKRKG